MVPWKKDTKSEADKQDEDVARVAAAILIQRLWRGRQNLAKQQHMNSKLRWDDAVTNAILENHRQAALDDDNGNTSARERWKRAAFFIGRLRADDNLLGDNGVNVRAEEKQLETQHWLELIDAKHRYGSNLKWYHKRWQEEDTRDNFFKWLDRGAGKDLSLDECPREQLERERILYLSAEQRLNYLVKIGGDGRLYWEKNNQLVDTTAGDWKDAGHGEGIVPESMPTHHLDLKKASSPAVSDSPKDQENAATHYAGQPTKKNPLYKYLRGHFTTRGMVDRLLRKTVKRNTWIYISDKHFNIYIGIKETGAFQHSSFLSGGIVTSAGLISVKQGIIHTLSPLSGHYRTSVDHFHKFLEVLESRGVDMTKVQISKAEAALWGIEHLAKFKKAQGRAISLGKRKIQEVPKKAEAVLEKSLPDTKWKEEILRGRESHHDERNSHPAAPAQGENATPQTTEKENQPAPTLHKESSTPREA